MAKAKLYFVKLKGYNFEVELTKIPAENFDDAINTALRTFNITRASVTTVSTWEWT